MDAYLRVHLFERSASSILLCCAASFPTSYRCAMHRPAVHLIHVRCPLVRTNSFQVAAAIMQNTNGRLANESTRCPDNEINEAAKGRGRKERAGIDRSCVIDLRLY